MGDSEVLNLANTSTEPNPEPLPSPRTATIANRASLTTGTRTSACAVLIGLCVGSLAGVAMAEISPVSGASCLPAVGGAVGGLLGLMRLRRVLWGMGFSVAICVLMIAYTPLVPWLVSTPPRSDLLEPADAVVALGAGTHSDGSLVCHSRDRSLHAIELLREGYAKELVLPVARDSWAPAVREQMANLGLSFPVDEPGPVANTHDEATVVAELARQHGWRRVILVTNAWHMPRAAATFKRAGVDVLRAPCSDSCADMVHPTSMSDHFRAFGCWLHETIGYRVYRARGWAD
jgi:uncharacterized SAM-binding protein YcdF (DUF218 family)